MKASACSVIHSALWNSAPGRHTSFIGFGGALFHSGTTTDLARLLHGCSCTHSASSIGTLLLLGRFGPLSRISTATYSEDGARASARVTTAQTKMSWKTSRKPTTGYCRATSRACGRIHLWAEVAWLGVCTWLGVSAWRGSGARRYSAKRTPSSGWTSSTTSHAPMGQQGETARRTHTGSTSRKTWAQSLST